MTVIATGTIIAFLYFARDLFIPVALAVLLSFLLAIPCSLLERYRFKRIWAVLVVVVLSFSVVAGIGLLATTQFYDLARKLPGYHSVIQTKLASLKASPHSTIGKVTSMLKQTAAELTAPEPPVSTNSPTEASGGGVAAKTQPAPIPVEIHHAGPGMWGVLAQMATPVLKPLGTGLIVLVVLLFMLIGRDDLRDRLIRLAGTDRMDLTTDALDEAASRVSRYLLMQLVVNCCFGLLIGIGLYFIGVPSPWLWGTLGVVLRFIPYVGPWIAAVAPFLLAFAIEPGWAKLGWTAGLFVTVELITANAIEPVLYGSSTGVSPIALLLAAIFWTWLWGPVGLLLSTPLTVCLAVLGLHTPQLRILHVLLGDEPVLTPETRFYQRLLAMDRVEADGIIESFVKEKSLPEVYEKILIPVLSFAKEDTTRGRLNNEKEAFVLDNISELVDELAKDAEGENADANASKDERRETNDAESVVAVIPAKDRADEIAGHMLREILAQRGIGVRALSADALTADCLKDLTDRHVKVVCISSVPPTGLRRARYLCKKLRLHFPGMKILVGWWGRTNDIAGVRESLVSCKADYVVTSFEEVRAVVVSLSTVEGDARESRVLAGNDA